MIETQERISRVEAALERYIEITAQSQAHFEATVAQSQVSVNEALKKLSEAQAKTEASLDRLSKEMAEFKNEMVDFKDEIWRNFKKESNKQWGKLAKKLGTWVGVVYATRKGVYAMAYLEWDYGDILNFDDLQDRGMRGSVSDTPPSPKFAL
ncbi:hypothetical protein MCHI_003709 [Candidatus Magnetoovum chiemensis]|nr:hypothetical protein MCHI_003709 [Candidatus Magnetoovum chiemensis]